MMRPTTNDSIRGNSIFGNGALGIDLVASGDIYPGITTNDLGDVDSGPKGLQNFPVITNASGGSGGTIIQASLNSEPNQNYFVDFYASPEADYSGYGEGKFYLSGMTVVTDVSGHVGFAFTNFIFDETGQYITATATSANGDTSEFSAAVVATNMPVASAQFGHVFAWRASEFVFNLTLATNFSYHVQATTNLADPPRLRG